MTKRNWLTRAITFMLATMMIFSVNAINAFAADSTKVSIGAPENAVELSAGTYSVPVSLKNAGNIANDSMAAGCLAKQAKIVVNNDGTVTAKLSMATLCMGGTIYGNAVKLSYYKEHNTSSEMVEATVESTRMGFVTPNFGASPKEEVEVPDVFSFEMPYLNQNGVYIQVLVDAMGMNPDAYVLFDFSKVEEIVDTTKLEALITECEAVEQNLYTNDSYNALTIVIAQAKELVESADKTAQSVDDMIAKLNSAKSALVFKSADYTEVDKAIASIPSDTSKYTDESVKKLEDAIAAVDRNLNINQQAQVDEMALAIQNAINALEEKAANTANEEVLSPQTGNNSNGLGWTLLLLCASVATITVTNKRKASSK